MGKANIPCKACIARRQICVKQSSNTNDVVYVIMLYYGPDWYSSPGLLSFLPALPAASLILSNTVLPTARRESKQVFICYEFSIKTEHKYYLLKYANGLLCAHKDTMGCLYVEQK